MGKHSKSKKGSKDRERDKGSKGAISKLIASPEKMVHKLQKWARKGKASKLSELLASAHGDLLPLLLAVKDAEGRGLLHQACSTGRAEVITVLLRHGADTEARDAMGNTPAHLAAQAGHLVAVTQLLQASQPPDIDECVNNRGVSIRQAVEAALGVTAGQGGDVTAGVSQLMQGRAGVAHYAADREEEEDEEEAWRRRLREEASDDEFGGGGAATGAGGAAGDFDDSAPFLGHGGGSESDDAWADRMWSEMLSRRRREAQASAAVFGSAMAREAAAREAAAREEAARLRSERILQQERARDAEWRRHAAGPLPQLEGGPGAAPAPAAPPPPLDVAAAHATYTARWLALDMRLQLQQQEPASAASQKKLHYADVPWPVAEGYSLRELQDVLLHGVQGPADIRKRLRAELMRWHTDKFTARLGQLLEAADVPRITARVKEVSQALTALMAGGI